MDWKEFWKEKKYPILTWFFIILQVAIVVRNIFDSYVLFFWFCDFTPIIIALGFRMRNNAIVKAVVNVILIPQMVFLMGSFLGTFIYPNFTRFTYLYEVYGVMNYLPKGWFYTTVTIITHLSSLIAMIAIINYKKDNKSLKYSAILIILTFIVTRIFTPMKENINYIYSLGNGILAGIGWILITFLILTVGTYYLQKLIQKISKNH